ncbi:unnamed protein product [Polarella glacialis]|uniref:Uncharacterized protein n=1 Tax=Polarella glacialis TaxID=89957 RepID=A0A813KX56_POLGL|nr:unnamed protein product [Polarella glacialis]
MVFCSCSTRPQSLWSHRRRASKCVGRDDPPCCCCCRRENCIVVFTAKVSVHERCVVVVVIDVVAVVVFVGFVIVVVVVVYVAVAVAATRRCRTGLRTRSYCEAPDEQLTSCDVLLLWLLLSLLLLLLLEATGEAGLWHSWPAGEPQESKSGSCLRRTQMKRPAVDHSCS